MPSSTKKIILALVLTLLLGTPSTKVFAETKDELMILYNSIQGDLTSGYKNSTNGITAQQNSLKTFLKFATVGNSTPTQADLDAAKKS